MFGLFRRKQKPKPKMTYENWLHAVRAICENRGIGEIANYTSFISQQGWGKGLSPSAFVDWYTSDQPLYIDGKLTIGPS